VGGVVVGMVDVSGEKTDADKVIDTIREVMQEIQDTYTLLDSFVYEAENVYEVRALIEDKMKSDRNFRDALNTVDVLSGLMNRETMAFDMQARIKNNPEDS
jgi:hypothetical protein